jgi:purine-cytosine permease-like protein
MLGSFFVPLFGVLLADWLLAGAQYTERDVFQAPSFRAGLVVAWLAGFAFYQWLYPQGPGWWLDVVDLVPSADLGIGATLPSFALSFLLTCAVVAVTRRAVAAETEGAPG